jgi:hypothetical protein
MKWVVTGDIRSCFPGFAHAWDIALSLLKRADRGLGQKVLLERMFLF